MCGACAGREVRTGVIPPPTTRQNPNKFYENPEILYEHLKYKTKNINIRLKK